MIDEFGCFGQDLSIAIYLLGLSLGYDKTYDALYQHSKLNIFQKEDKEGESNENVVLSEDVASLRLFPSGDSFVENRATRSGARTKSRVGRSLEGRRMHKFRS